jgi:hypothetical protein
VRRSRFRSERSESIDGSLQRASSMGSGARPRSCVVVITIHCVDVSSDMLPPGKLWPWNCDALPWIESPVRSSSASAATAHCTNPR